MFSPGKTCPIFLCMLKLAKKSCSVFSTNSLKTSKFLRRSFFKKVFIAIISGKIRLVFPPTHLHIKVSKVFRCSF